MRHNGSNMKPKFSLSLFVVLALASLLPTPFIQAQTNNDRVRIDVSVKTDGTRKTLKGTGADTVTQSKTLQIAISGKSKSPETRTGTWTIYGCDLLSNSITAVESGDFKIELVGAAQQKIESRTFSSTYTPEHTVSSVKGGRRGRSSVQIKKVEATGTKYIGYSVVVKDGAVVVGEVFYPGSSLSKIRN